MIWKYKKCKFSGRDTRTINKQEGADYLYKLGGYLNHRLEKVQV